MCDIRKEKTELCVRYGWQVQNKLAFVQDFWRNIRLTRTTYSVYTKNTHFFAFLSKNDQRLLEVYKCYKVIP